MSAMLNIVENNELAGRIKFDLLNAFGKYRAVFGEWLLNNPDMEECAGSLVAKAMAHVVNTHECYVEAINRSAPYLTHEEFVRMMRVFQHQGTHALDHMQETERPNERLYSKLYLKDEFFRYTASTCYMLGESIASNGDILFTVTDHWNKHQGHYFSFVNPDTLISRITNIE